MVKQRKTTIIIIIDTKLRVAKGKYQEQEYKPTAGL
jgi:hypothetical protein